MDSNSHFASTTSVTEKNSKIVIPSKRDLFLSTYQPHQPWSLPDSLIYYISKDPSSSKVYEKLIQSCKYFFIKTPILIVSRVFLNNEKNGWKILLNRKEIDLKNINCKIWITDCIFCSNNAENVNDQYIFTSIFPKIFQCDAKDIFLFHQNIEFNDLVFLASKCEKADLFNATIMDENGSVVAVEKRFEAFPAVKEFIFDVRGNIAATEIITSKTAKNLINIPYFVTLDRFELVNIPESFDIDTFFSYIKKNKKTRVDLKFAQNISQHYRNVLQIIVNEIIQAEIRDYRPPFIDFPGMNESSFLKLCKLIFRG